MRREGIQPKKRRRRYPVTTQRQAGVVLAPNHLNQNFSAALPNTKWVSDFTYIDTAEGWLYLAVILDLFSRKVVGWAMAKQMDTALVENALRMALHVRQPDVSLLHHSDQGSQYTSAAYQSQLSEAKIQTSMSRVGNCYDNAVAESFFGTLKSECVTAQFATHALARTAIFEYIEVWYNRKRLHSTIGYLSPAEFERLHGHYLCLLNQGRLKRHRFCPLTLLDTPYKTSNSVSPSRSSIIFVLFAPLFMNRPPVCMCSSYETCTGGLFLFYRIHS
jgi:transposase InsO family protein